LKLTEEKIFILYKDVLAEVEPTKSIREIAKSVNRHDSKPYSKNWMWKLLNTMCSIKVVEKVLDEPKALRFRRTKKGERIIKAESLDDLRR
jgi:hypothetical protein